jgi:hypothetical protein
MSSSLIKPLAPSLATPRRGFLKQLGLGLSAFPLAACFPRAGDASGSAGGAGGGGGGGGAGGAAALPLDEAEAQVLAAEFLMEDYAIFAYTAAAPALDDATRAVVTLFRDHHKAHQDHAGETLIARGLSAPTPPETYDVELPSDPIAILRLALSLEAQAVNGYHAFVAQHGDPALRTVAASILACEVTHAVALLQALGDDDAVAFAFGTDLPSKVNAFLTGYP